MNMIKQEKMTKKMLKKVFSLSEDSTSNDEIRTRLLDGETVTGTDTCVLI